MSISSLKYKSNSSLSKERENIFYNKISSLMKFPYENNNKSKCRIISETDNESFTIENLMYLLSIHNDPGILDYLTNLLHTRFSSESFFYLNQICTMCTYKEYYDPFYQFLIDKCLHNFKFCVRIRLFLNSFPKTEERIQELNFRLEQILNTENTKDIVDSKMVKIAKLEDIDFMVSKPTSKESRIYYYYRCLEFFSDLNRLCLLLFSNYTDTDEPPRPSRSRVLKEFINLFNEHIDQIRLENYEKIAENIGCEKLAFENDDIFRFNKGFLLPFNGDRNLESKSWVVCRIIPELSLCFKTKSRSPIKLTCECVEMGEGEKFYDLYDIKSKIPQTNTSKSNNDNIYVNNQFSIFEKWENIEKNLTTEKETKVKKKPKNVEEVLKFDTMNFFESSKKYKSLNHTNSNKSNKSDISSSKSLNLTNPSNKSSTKVINELIKEESFFDGFEIMENEDTSGKEKNDDKKNNDENNIQIVNNENNKYLSSKNDQIIIEESKKSDTISDEFEFISYDKDKINPFGIPKEKVFEEYKQKSEFRNFKTYRIKSFIAKANDDLTQEMFALQLIKLFEDIYRPLNIFVKSYEVIVTSGDSGLIEFLNNTCSIDGILKLLPKKWTLNKFYRVYFEDNFKKYQKEFANSLAGFCLISYFLEIKDRNNGNIMLDNKGHIFHIDFGFILGISPGGIKFETDLKISKDYVDILDGKNSEIFAHFKKQIVRGIIAARENYQIFETMLVIMNHSKLNCLNGKNIEDIIQGFKQKFLFNYNEEQIKIFVDELVNKCCENIRTGWYDWFQYWTNNIKY